MAQTHSRSKHKGETPQYAYALAILSGGGAYVTSQLPVAPQTVWVAYALSAALFGFVWPARGLQWGGWLCLPVVLLVCFDLVVTGNIVSVVLVHGMMLAKAFTFACLGALVGSKLSLHLTNHPARRKILKSSRSGAETGPVLNGNAAPRAALKTISASESASRSAQALASSGALSAVNAALLDAAREGDLNRLGLLIADGAEVNAQSNHQWTPLVPEAHALDGEGGLTLFGKGASSNANGGKGWTPLMVATIEGQREVVRALLEHGVEVNAENYEGWTAVRFAVSMDETEILRLLLDAGADADVADHEGQTALMQAARENSRESLKALLGAGADPMIEDRHQQTALKIAQEHGHAEVISLLEEAETETAPEIETPARKSWRSPARLLMAAAIFHLALTITIFLSGRYALAPATFDSNGVGISFAIDGLQYRAEAAELSEVLKRKEVFNWLTSTRAFHVKLYAVCFALFGPLFGQNIISAEPLNILCYLATLALVFRIGREAFSQRVGLIAAAAVAVWPSFLIHTTQLLRDPLFIAGMLALVLILLRLACTRTYSWKEALLAGGGGGLAAAALWVVRGNMGEIVLATAFVAAAALVARQFGGGRTRITNLCGMALLIATTIGAQQVLPRYGPPGRDTDPASTEQKVLPAGDAGSSALATDSEAAKPSIWTRMAEPILSARHRFIRRYATAGSNIDRDVRLNGMGELILYLPRAAAIGFFAPFPRMWLTSGKQVGATGRRLAGLETFFIYLVEAFALFGLWRNRRRLPAWFLFLVAAAGIIALGYVVINIAALFRMRFVFLIPVIILGAEGAASAFGRFEKGPQAKEHLSASEV